jgi:hypothetical protein
MILAMLMLIFSFASLSLDARPKESGKGSDDQQLRQALGVYDLQQNTVSNIQFYTTNYGIFGLNVAQNRGGGFWPRGSQNQYIFAGGIWFGAIKKRPNDTSNTDRKYVTITYNPNSGTSWMVPGRLNPLNTSQDLVESTLLTKYRTYFSTDFKQGDGGPIKAEDGENWPIWDVNKDDKIKNDRYFGKFVDDNSLRNTSTYDKGPAFISGEDIFATFKDTDLSRYDDGAGQRKNQGYPLRLQYEQMIYSWGFGDYRDFIFLKYDIANYSKDTLRECWMAPVMDVDIALAQNAQGGAGNDRVRFYDEDTTLNLALQWSMGDQGEKGQGFGYLGFDFLESPAVFRTQSQLPPRIQETINGNITTYDVRDYMALETKVENIGGKDTLIIVRDTLVRHQRMVVTNNGGTLDTVRSTVFDITGYLRRDKKFYANEEQLGLRTFRNWPISEDKSGDDERYNYMSSRARDGDNGPGDKRFLMATGPFNMLPGDTVRVVVGIMLAKPHIREEADGSVEDVTKLIAIDKFAQQVYDDNFRAPMPPFLPEFGQWTPYNNAIKLTWKNTSEQSVDDYENGLAFMGYKLYRARRTDLDTFNIYNIGPTNQHTKGSGPFGWKQLAEWRLPTPYVKSTNRAGTVPTDATKPFIDSLRIVGPYYTNQGTIDSNAIRIMRVGQGVRLMADTVVKAFDFFASYPFRGAAIPIIGHIDTAVYSQPWGPHYASLVKKFPIWYNPYNPASNNEPVFDILIGKLNLDPALVKFNPLLTDIQTVNVNPLDTPLIPNKIGDTIYLKSTYRVAYINGAKQLLVDRVIPINIQNVMRDTTRLKSVLQTLYGYIQKGYAKTEFVKFEQSEVARKQIIDPYMKLVTNDRTFVDLGDDNKDGRITTNTDPTKTEKLINSVDYFYKLLSYDEGDYNQPTPTKMNDGVKGLSNFEVTHPATSPVGNKSQFTVTYVDTAKLGGLYNFNFFAADQERVNQLLGGHELELEFQPWWTLSDLDLGTRRFRFGMYYRSVTVKDLTTGQYIFMGRTVFEQTPCSWSYRGGFTEDAVSWYLADSVIVDPYDPSKNDDFGTFHSYGIKQRTGEFTTGDFTRYGYCYSAPFLPPVENTFGFSFNYSIQQHGGHFRPDSNSKRVTPGMTPIIPQLGFGTNTDTTYITTTARSGMDAYGYDLVYGPLAYGAVPFYGQPTYGSFNNGPGDFLVTFEPGGTETMDLKFGAGGNTTNKFNVPYLTMKIKNVLSYKRPTEKGPGDSATVAYQGYYTHLDLAMDTIAKKGTANLRSLGKNTNDYIGKFNLSAMPWVNSRNDNSAMRIARQRAKVVNAPVAFNAQILPNQGRYYLSAVSVDGKDTVDFVNQVNIAGVNFNFDYANKGRFEKDMPIQWDYIPISDYVYGQDFKAGDQVTLKVRGGAFGLPEPGAKVRVKVSESKVAADQVTDKMLEQVTVVPNPFYISHQMQQSPYDSKLYFTKLPEKCKISIYTITGDLVREFEHDETSGYKPYEHSIDIWDLLSTNNQRVQSQTLIAIIKSPNGAEQVVPFSVVVGGFRLIQSDTQQ